MCSVFFNFKFAAMCFKVNFQWNLQWLWIVLCWIFRRQISMATFCSYVQKFGLYSYEFWFHIKQPLKVSFLKIKDLPRA